LSWSAWPEGTTQLSYQLSNAGKTARVTVDDNAGNQWQRQLRAEYPGEAGKKYKYTVKLWTESEEYTLGSLTYQWNDTDGDIQMNGGSSLNITSSEQTLVWVGQPLINGGGYWLQFQCGIDAGTFYIEIVSIEETDEEPTVL
jgi:hypothetical protein